MPQERALAFNGFDFGLPPLGDGMRDFETCNCKGVANSISYTSQSMDGSCLSFYFATQSLNTSNNSFSQFGPFGIKFAGAANATGLGYNNQVGEQWDWLRPGYMQMYTQSVTVNDTPLEVQFMYGPLDSNSILVYITKADAPYKLYFWTSCSSARSVSPFVLDLSTGGKIHVGEYISTGESSHAFVAVHPIRDSGSYPEFTALIEKDSNSYGNTTNRWMNTVQLTGPAFLLFTMTRDINTSHYIRWIEQAVPKLESFRLTQLFAGAKNNPGTGKEAECSQVDYMTDINVTDHLTGVFQSGYTVNAGAFSSADVPTPGETYRFNVESSTGDASPYISGKTLFMPNDYGAYCPNKYNLYNYAMEIFLDDGPGNSRAPLWYAGDVKTSRAQNLLTYTRQRVGFGWCDFAYGWLSPAVYCVAVTAASAPFKLYYRLTSNYSTCCYNEDLSYNPFHAKILKFGSMSLNNTSYPFGSVVVLDDMHNSFEDIMVSPVSDGNATQQYFSREWMDSALILFMECVNSRTAALQWCKDNEYFLRSIKNGMLFRALNPDLEYPETITYKLGN